MQVAPQRAFLVLQWMLTEPAPLVIAEHFRSKEEAQGWIDRTALDHQNLCFSIAQLVTDPIRI